MGKTCNNDQPASQPRMWFSKGIPPKCPDQSGFAVVVVFLFDVTSRRPYQFYTTLQHGKMRQFCRHHMCHTSVILLIEQFVYHLWDVNKNGNTGINYQPQLVNAKFLNHQQCIILATQLCQKHQQSKTLFLKRATSLFTRKLESWKKKMHFFFGSPKFLPGASC